MTSVSLEPFQMGGGVLSSITPFLHEHSWAVLLGILPHCSESLQLRGSTCKASQRPWVLRFREKMMRNSSDLSDTADSI